MNSSESELSDSDVELQNAFAEGRLKPGLNIVEEAPKKFVNNVAGLRQKLQEFKLNLKWIEVLDCVSQQAPLAPELAARMYTEEQKRENQLKNNKKLAQYSAEDDPVLNDFKRETTFYRQAQSTVMEAMPRLKSLGVATLRPDDYFAEMAKSDEQMQKIRHALVKKQAQQKQSERVKELRQQKKEGKRIQIERKLQKQKEKKEMLEEVKKVRKGVKKDMDFLNRKGPSKKAVEKRNQKDKKFGFGGKKRGKKSNTRESSSDFTDHKSFKSHKDKGGKSLKNRRLGKNRRKQSKK
ncbi:probable rRNA-processing protein EBP2 homolog [Coccinella septempunctata]|uniref:probable rRNA-processing protein EBP2 homolog n=1 Tax=Coccinella septempunctata TaxID=41139 RepID=UPI001D08682B|nr:probable rRNA-processing protein EBP2 homolog [Coccinella septempunctata]